MPERDPFAEALADLAPPVDARAMSEAVASATSLWLPVAAVALVVSAALAALPPLGLLPALPAAVVALVGYALAPGIVMLARVRAQLGVRRAQRAGVSLGADVDARLRRIHALAVGSLLLAVPHAWVLAQVAGLWWYGR